MTHNGHTDAIEKIKALEKERQTFLIRVKVSEEVEEAIARCLRNNGFKHDNEARNRIMFHVSRILNEYRSQERIRFEKKVEAI